MGFDEDFQGRTALGDEAEAFLDFPERQPVGVHLLHGRVQADEVDGDRASRGLFP
jgi:hypothetical protein